MSASTSPKPGPRPSTVQPGPGKKPAPKPGPQTSIPKTSVKRHPGPVPAPGLHHVVAVNNTEKTSSMTVKPKPQPPKKRMV